MKSLLESQMEKMVVQMAEVHARQRRIETSLFRVAEQVGVTYTPANNKVSIRTSTSVDVFGLDATLGSIKRALEETGNYPPQDLVGVYVRDSLVAEIDFIS